MTTKEAQSEAPSVVTPQDIRDIFNRYGMNYSQIVGDENTVVSASLYTYNKAIDDIVAKINRLIIEAELRGFDKAFDSHDYDGLREYRAALSNNLSKGDV